MEGQPISFERSVKFLDLRFDKNISWKTHIEYLRTKVAQTSNILKTLAHLKWGADRKTLPRIYKGVIIASLPRLWLSDLLICQRKYTWQV